MPFVYPRQTKKEKNYPIRDFAEIDKIVRKALEEVEDNGRFTDYVTKRVVILSIFAYEPPSKLLKPEKYLVDCCLAKGLNLGEIEKWLDQSFFSKEFYFDKTSSVHIDERRLAYHLPDTFHSCFSADLTWFRGNE
ncbi:MAG: hypothetical protein NT129_03850 [Candidatus Aenigmarchaeota archaeon]|nr:hypothetical protein [Candidatus Aenigmarchaeota archaeon]